MIKIKYVQKYIKPVNIVVLTGGMVKALFKKAQEPGGVLL